MHRFFCDNADFSAGTVHITNPQEIHHLKVVLRLKKGSWVQLFNDRKQEAEGTIESVTPSDVQIRIESQRSAETTQRVELILACAIPKKAKFEFIIEKCTELGISEIIPLKTARTEFSADEERKNKKLERYRSVAINAAKQCRRSSIPVIQPIQTLAQALAKLDGEISAFIPCLTGDREPLPVALTKAQGVRKIIFFIGPEGDFTTDELKNAVKAGCQPVSLGPTTLKVDTAAITVIAFSQIFLSAY